MTPAEALREALVWLDGERPDTGARVGSVIGTLLAHGFTIRWDRHVARTADALVAEAREKDRL